MAQNITHLHHLHHHHPDQHEKSQLNAHSNEDNNNKVLPYYQHYVGSNSMSEPFLCFPKLPKVFWADIQIFCSAFCFGIGFIGQRAVMVEGLGPMTCNALRFGLSALLLAIVVPILPEALLVVAYDSDDNDDVESHQYNNHSGHETNLQQISESELEEINDKSMRLLSGGMGELEHFFGRKGWMAAQKSVLFWGLLLGLINFMGSGLQQLGISLTSANKVAFIAGFDLFLTPIFSLFIPTLKRNGKPTPSTWVAVLISMFGLYLLSVSEISDLHIGTGELLTLISTVFWTLHITYTDIATSYVDTMKMMQVQLTIVSGLSMVIALLTESFSNFSNHIVMYLPWMVFLAVVEGMGFTFMAMGQRLSPPTHAAIILSLEGVFASVASYFVLGETLSIRELIGCCLMLFATAFAKIGSRFIDKSFAS